MRSRRRGYTLAECLVVITLIGTVMGTVALTLHALSRADRRLRDELAHDRSVDRFVAQLRSDTHQAVSATIDEPSSETDPKTELKLTLSGEQTIGYTIHPHNIERVVRRAEAIQHRETYPLIASATGWQFHNDGTSPVVSLVLELDASGRGNEKVVPRGYRVDATVCLVSPTLPSSEE
ncbi:MAG: prepilin-type N-terminal cleavage/methylation domain-containing protein [Pirellulaceae bacterium]|nr:prepilin-type N-terminal cleavage/methylation domain-containing protein [Pirellulaceae bacterium]